MPSVRRGFRAGLCNFSPNSVNSRRWTVLVLTLHPLSCSWDRIFSPEVIGERVTIFLIKRLSRGLKILGRPVLFLSAKVPSFLNFWMALWTAVLLTFNLLPIWRSDNFHFAECNDLSSLRYTERCFFTHIFAPNTFVLCRSIPWNYSIVVSKLANGMHCSRGVEIWEMPLTDMTSQNTLLSD